VLGVARELFATGRLAFTVLEPHDRLKLARADLAC